MQKSVPQLYLLIIIKCDLKIAARKPIFDMVHARLCSIVGFPRDVRRFGRCLKPVVFLIFLHLLALKTHQIKHLRFILYFCIILIIHCEHFKLKTRLQKVDILYSVSTFHQLPTMAASTYLWLMVTPKKKYNGQLKLRSIFLSKLKFRIQKMGYNKISSKC